MKLYRLMSKAEASGVCSDFPLSWSSKFKWFTDDPEFLKRVSDGSFNNSAQTEKYVVLVVYDVKYPEILKRVSTHELMLARKDQPMAGISLISKEPLCHTMTH